ncbi:MULTISPECIES: ABC transporter ATP-binding protein [unclassified Campylobacter]|uniref:ABC transporter ATP-binding protein n=1 Tax=unclassified Campylobacter TaxID=2593542 RepID=UPI0022E9E6FB|nr:MULTISPECIES: ABC transporter ATP-binding protein [unclassified Campylobacter]MDA3043563.1 ABC transporter ATP-binding protein/permease [Campylobacter sp. JMF_09 ED2]MDA3044110.1 ABC transporter ATP-binding protein/permease [Campylobacter sp. JMF_07 ED4]MDA3049266.1 ABC transporter ATP-binding protein/permease [Campylobacter sp. JMF_15 NE4]MDA3051309.1 ABC transporter ATP-binding protein/permease [Campylobacter sp. JMF_02 ED1]MDA3063460.1 ABC transporter ATP-binding protein/permease [Campyl
MNDFKTILTRFKPFLIDYKIQFALAFLGMIMTSLATSASAYLVKPVLDYIFVEKNTLYLYPLAFAIIAVFAMKSAGTFIQTYYTSFIGQDTVRRLRDLLVSKLIRLDLKFFNTHSTGELISRTMNDIERIRTVVSNMIPDFVTQIITIFGLLGVVIYNSPKLSFFALVVFPAAIYPLSRLAKRMKKVSRQSLEKTSDITSALNQIFTNIEIVKASNAQNFEVKHFEEENSKFFKLNLKAIITNSLVSPVMEMLGALGVAVVIIVGGKEVIEGKMSIGSFFSFLTALFMVYTPIKKVSSLHNKMQDATAATERTFELIDLEPAIIGGSLKMGDISTLSFENVSLSYDEKIALKDINFSVKKGQILALVGNSGGGKSSVVNLIMRYYDAKSGNILFDGNEISEFDIASLRDNIGFVSQRIYIFNDTIAANVSYGAEFDEERVINALRLANAYEFVAKMEDGINTLLSEFGANLSGGQRQRIAIARALYKNPQILIFDEATSALDNASEKEISSVIEKIKADKIVIVIAHRLSTIKNASQIAVVKNGEIIAMGDDETLSANCDEYRILKGLAKD